MTKKERAQLRGDHKQILSQIRRIRLSDRKAEFGQFCGLLLILSGLGIAFYPVAANVVWPSYVLYLGMGAAIVGIALLALTKESKLDDSRYKGLEYFHNLLIAKYSAQPPFAYCLELRSPTGREFLVDSSSNEASFEQYPKISSSTYRCSLLEASMNLVEGEKLELSLERKTMVKSTTTRKFGRSYSRSEMARESSSEQWENETTKVEETFIDQISVKISVPDPSFSFPQRPRCEFQAEAEPAPVGFAGPLPSSKTGSSGLFYDYRAEGNTMRLHKECEVDSDFNTNGLEYLLDEALKQLQMAKVREK